MQRERFRNIFVTMLAIVGAMWAPAVAAQEASTATSAHGMVAADHPRASQVGADILAAGGNAFDASVATLLALGVVNPFASGLGGGGFCVVRPQNDDVAVIDFRERAPAAATRDMYIDASGKADIDKTIKGGLAVAVPGEVRGLEALHKRYGKAKWSDVVRPARELAAAGFEVGELLPKRLAAKEEALVANPALAAAFRKGDRWVRAGETLKRPGLARTLRLIEQKGAAPFHGGEVGDAIAQTVRAAGGIITPRDLVDYQVTWREPLRGSYRGFEIFTMPPPSSGGTTILATLNVLERFDMRTLGYNPESIHRITEALKHAFADRARWLGDADFVSVPTETLISKSEARATEIHPIRVLPADAYGTSAPPPDDDGTTHVSIIDGDGNMSACTSTINTSFGSMVYVEAFGLVLNNEMGDFTAQPGVPNNYGLVGTDQNAVAAGKRPLSSMSPTIVLTQEGEPYLVVGASGGPTIITGTLLALIRTIDWGWSPADAIARPRIHHQWMPEVLYSEGLEPSWLEVLKRRGHAVKVGEGYNSVQMVVRHQDGKLTGVSDPRKNGRPAGVATKQ